MKIRAAKDKIVILPLDAAEVTPGGIILTKDAQEVSNRGVVISSGSDQCSPGDTVVFTRYVGCEWEHDRKKYYIITEEHLLAIEEDEELEAARKKKAEFPVVLNPGKPLTADEIDEFRRIFSNVSEGAKALSNQLAKTKKKPKSKKKVQVVTGITDKGLTYADLEVDANS